jgi:hypothetical protein
MPVLHNGPVVCHFLETRIPRMHSMCAPYTHSAHAPHTHSTRMPHARVYSISFEGGYGAAVLRNLGGGVRQL